MNGNFMRRESRGGTTIKLHRGECYCLVGFDLDQAHATEDFVGFALEFLEPGASGWKRVFNRLRFSYDGVSQTEKKRGAPSTEAPIQKFRWMHFPYNPKNGEYRYRDNADIHARQRVARSRSIG